MNINIAKRIYAFDLLKCFAMFLVIYGHLLQFFLPGGAQGKPIYSLIYSFHMALFMMVSGYFFFNSMGRYNFIEILKDKFFTLIVPSITYTCIAVLASICIRNDWTDCQQYLFDHLWFLKSLFCCQIAAFVLQKLNRFFLGGVIGIAFFYIFNRWQLSGMFPAFFMGMMLKKYDIWWKDEVNLLLLISLFTYIVSLVIRFSLAEYSPLIEIIVRFLIPLCGSLFIISLFWSTFRNYTKKNRWTDTFNYWGTKTKELYILQGLLFEFGLIYVWKYIHFNPILFNLFYGPLFTLILMWIIIHLNELLQKNKIVNILLLGHLK